MPQTPATGKWSFGTLADGATATLVIAVRVDVSVVATNVAVASSDTFDPNPDDNTASATVTEQQADLSLTKTVNDPSPNVGEVVTYTVPLTDLGPDTATNVVVQDQLPPGLSFVSASPSQGNYDSTTGTWTVGAVPSSA